MLSFLSYNSFDVKTLNSYHYRPESVLQIKTELTFSIISIMFCTLLQLITDFWFLLGTKLLIEDNLK